MIEHENVRDVLKTLIDLAGAKNFTTNGRESTVEDVQELFAERIYNLADLLGFENLYLDRD